MFRRRSTDDASLPTVVPQDTRRSQGPILEVTLCNVRYGLVPALRGVSLKVGAGEMVALLGANGAGKTTTLRTISGLIHPYSGTVTFEGERIDTLPPQDIVKRGIAHLPEGRDLFPGLSVRENLRYGYWPRRHDKAGYGPSLDLVLELFPRLRERISQKAGTLSGGEQQMLAAGMALMSKPKLLLVDELSLGLAPMVVGQLFEALIEVNKTGTAILLVEQFVPLALANTHRAYVLAKGQVTLDRPSADLREDQALLASYLGEAIPESDASQQAPRAAGGAPVVQPG
jgi:branched-chain amino acid transport system ATP-binding protein